MADLKKWTVTYTKHITQKRKVYQDGVLELRSSKVFLYDDSGKVLGTKFVKKDELVGSGESLTFDGYLVDIGDLDRDCDPLADLNGREKDLKSSVEKPVGNLARASRPSFRYNIKKESPDKNIARKNRFSVKFNPTQENENTGLGSNNSMETEPSVKDKIEREWPALYTSQKTQKAKKYHDGIIRLVSGASFDRKQVFLYDVSHNQLDSKYLKKDEIVECGGALIFDGYLVDIGDREESSKPLSGVKIHESSKRAMEDIERLQAKEKNSPGKDVVTDNCPSVINKIKTESGDRGLRNSVVPENCQNVAEKSNREWDVLYTTQKTQKAKKYHDGMLRLHVGSAHRRQVTLLNEDGTTLSSKYLNSSEDVSTGSRLILASHLVEVGKARISKEGELQNDKDSVLVVPSFSRGSTVDKIKSNASGVRNNCVTDGNVLRSDSGSSEKLKASQISTHDVSEIKDRVPDSSVATENCPSITDKTNGEWNVFYTAQKSQKAKKYHEGVLRIHVGAAHRRQATLLDEDGKILSTKYLNLSTENIKSGSKLELASHLVEICEARISQEGKIQDGKKSVLVPSFSRVIKNNSTTNEKVLDSDSGSSSEKPKSNQGNIRNANQILLTLRKPTSEKLCPVKEPVTLQSRGSFMDILEESPDDIMVISQLEDIHKPSCSSPDNGSKTENYNQTSVTGLQVPDFFVLEVSENTETLHTEVSAGNVAYPENSNPLKRKAKELSHANEFPSFDLGF